MKECDTKITVYFRNVFKDLAKPQFLVSQKEPKRHSEDFSFPHMPWCVG